MLRVSFIIITFSLLTIFDSLKSEENYNNLIKIYIERNVLVNEGQLTTSDSKLNDLMKEKGVIKLTRWLPTAKENDSYENIFLSRYYLVKFLDPIKELEEIINLFSRLNTIRLAEHVPIASTNDTPNDEYWQQLYGLRQINAGNAFNLWDYQNDEIPGFLSNDEVVVGIVDLGLMWDHPDLIDNIWRNLGEDADGDGDVIEFIDNQWVFDPGDTNSIDDDGDGFVDNFLGYDVASENNDPHPRQNLILDHGTLVAGCVSAMTNNEIGVASVGWSVKLMGISCGQDPPALSHPYEGLLAAAQMGADIINMSFGSTSWTESNQVLINFISEEFGCVLVASAGNSGVQDANYPASYDNVISVTATDPGNNFDCWPNFHETVDIAAPGSGIWTTTPFTTLDQDMYEPATGTSFSSPIVAGSLALLKTVFPHGDSKMLELQILNSVSYFDDMDGDCDGQSLAGMLGAGQLNVYDALTMQPLTEVEVTDIYADSQGGLSVPGDTNEIVLSLVNVSGSSPIEDMLLQLSTSDSSISIINDEFLVEGVIPSGIDFDISFLIASDEMTSFGDIPFNLDVSANLSGNFPSGLELEPFFDELEIRVPFGFEQDGYPINDVQVYGEPLFTNLYGNSFSQIFFNTDSTIMGKWISGFDVLGFPFDAGSRITTTLSSGDLDGNGDGELVFGTESGTLYALNKDGSSYLEFVQSDSIIGFPVLYDLNETNELKIIFLSMNDTASTIHVIDHGGEYVEGFPISFDGEFNQGVSVADLNLDGTPEIISCSTDGIVIAVNTVGELIPEFPAALSSIISTPVTVANIDMDNELEIMVGTMDGLIYIIKHNGSITQNFSSNEAICSGLSIADLDQNGSMEIIFNTADNLLHAWESETQTELEGWPVSNNNKSVTEPIIIDLNNDLRLEVLSGTISGDINIFKHHGGLLENFPYLSNDSIHFTPAIGDLDGDDDLELIIGTENNLKVIDILDEAGGQYSWNTFRGNSHRNGFYDSGQSYLSNSDDIILSDFRLGKNYPNPFNPSTRISFTTPREMNISVIVYDVLGRRVKTLINGLQKKGNHHITWFGHDQSGSKVSSGIYFYEMRGDGFIQARKMLLIK